VHSAVNACALTRGGVGLPDDGEVYTSGLSMESE
jgi:hypothetical protein